MGADPPDQCGVSDRAERIALSERVRALERAVSDADDPPSPVPDVSNVATDLNALTDRVDAIEATVEELDARQQAVEAYADRIEHVNETIERRADAALAAVDRLESATSKEPHPSPNREATGPPQHHERTRQDAPGEPAKPRPPNPSGGTETGHVADAASATGGRDSGSSDTDPDPDSGEPGLFARLLGR